LKDVEKRKKQKISKPVAIKIFMQEKERQRYPSSSQDSDMIEVIDHKRRESIDNAGKNSS